MSQTIIQIPSNAVVIKVDYDSLDDFIDFCRSLENLKQVIYNVKEEYDSITCSKRFTLIVTCYNLIFSNITFVKIGRYVKVFENEDRLENEILKIRKEIEEFDKKLVKGEVKLIIDDREINLT